MKYIFGVENRQGVGASWKGDGSQDCGSDTPYSVKGRTYMGHYDSCYAHDDFSGMSFSEKEKYYAGFEKDLERNEQVQRTCDDVSGYILAEWGRSKGYHVSGGFKETIVRKRVSENGD